MRSRRRSRPKVKWKKPKRRSWMEEAMSLFPDSRELTKEEAEAVNRALIKLSKPTGRNIFDLPDKKINIFEL